MNKPLILVVDDESYIAELLAELLTDEIECEIELAFNGLQALSLVRQHRPTLVITDLMMPYMDGQALIRALHAEQMDDIPIITMSAAQQRPTWLDEDKLAFIAKPFDPRELLRTVNAILSKSSRFFPRSST